MSPIKAVLRFFAWSYSRLHDWEECGRKAKLKHLDKSAPKEPEAPAMARGSAMHKTAELWSTKRHTDKKIPDELKLFEAEFIELRKIARRLNVEQQLAFDKNWNPCSWFGPEAWLRVVCDCEWVDDDNRVHVVDYKSGKIRDDHLEQLSLYAIAMFIKYPRATHVDTSLWYLDAGELKAETYERKDLAKLQKLWLSRSEPMLSDTEFKPTPGRGCRFCFYGQNGKQKGGPGICEF